MSPRLSSPAHPSSGGGGGGGGASGGGGRGRGRGEDRRNSGLIGQTVRIVQGPYKGEVIFIVLIACFQHLILVSLLLCFLLSFCV
jgi:hypothetical protein